MNDCPGRLTLLRKASALVALAGLVAGCAESDTSPWKPSEIEPGPPSIVIGSGHDEPAEDGERTGTVRIRLMAANITSGNNQSYEDPGIRIFKGTAPDVVMIQELNYGSNSAAELRSFVDTTFGPGFHYYREGGAQIPNGVVSRWPIVASGEWDDPRAANRDFAWARIDIPGSTDLYVVSVHLLTADPATRDAEAQALVSFLSQIPAGAYVALGGDFNTDTRDEPCVSTLGQAFVVG